MGGTTWRPDIIRWVFYYMTVGTLNLSHSHLISWVSCTRWEEATKVPYLRPWHLSTKVIITDAEGMAQWSVSRGPELKSQDLHCGPQTPGTATSKNPMSSGLKTPAHMVHVNSRGHTHAQKFKSSKYHYDLLILENIYFSQTKSLFLKKKSSNSFSPEMKAWVDSHASSSRLTISQHFLRQ